MCEVNPRTLCRSCQSLGFFYSFPKELLYLRCQGLRKSQITPRRVFGHPHGVSSPRGFPYKQRRGKWMANPQELGVEFPLAQHAKRWSTSLPKPARVELRRFPQPPRVILLSQERAIAGHQNWSCRILHCWIETRTSLPTGVTYGQRER